LSRDQPNTSRARSRFEPKWRLRTAFRFAVLIVLTLAGIARSLAYDQPQAGRHFERESNIGVPHDRSGDDASDEKTPADAVRANADDIETIVLTADAQPAANARIIAASAGTNVLLTNGELDRFSSYPFRWRTDRKGRFYAPATQANAWLVVTHPAGSAIFKPAARAKHRNIMLDPWCRVEGRYRSGTLPAAGAHLMILRHDAVRLTKNGPRFLMTFEATTGPDAHFMFERVPVGNGWIRADERFLHRAAESGMASSYVVGARFPAGKTVHVDVRSTGRSIVGSLQMPPGLQKEAEWRFAKIQLHASRFRGIRGHSYFFAIVNDKGQFRIDDVPPDEYLLSVVAIVQSRPSVLEKTITLQSADGAVAPPVDLGVLVLPEK
jgi:hypothetical protein